MVSRKYTKDYRLEPYLDSRGRLRDRAVYCGDYYVFEESKDVIRKRFIRLVIMTAVFSACVLVPFLVPNLMTRQMYVMLPQCFALIPVYMLLAAISRIVTAKGPVIREHRDRIVIRMDRAVVTALIFSLISLVGTVVALFLVDGLKTADWIVAACGTARALVCVAMLPLRSAFRMKVTAQTPELPEN